jgi:hypothetical protein
MKTNLLTLLFCASFASLHAQTELKINPLGLIFSSPNLSAEFAAKDNVGIEAIVGASWYTLTVIEKYKSFGANAGVLGKYYFNPETTIDKFYAGIYLRGGSNKFTSEVTSANSFSRSFFAGGFAIGQKWVSRNNIVFELGTGIGRNIVSKVTSGTGTVNLAAVPLLNIDFFLRLDVGYRFGGVGKKK